MVFHEPSTAQTRHMLRTVRENPQSLAFRSSNQVANWFPGNFGNFLHDTLPLVLWLNRFGELKGGDRIGIVDEWLHRTIIRWLHPGDMN
jgi:hypothetical protein